MILIRADGNSKIGSGHIMRCLALAFELRKHGEKVTFVTADSCMEDTIAKWGFESVSLESQYDELGMEKPLFINVIKSFKPSLVIVDSYFASESYVGELTSICKTAIFDDFGKQAYDVDFLINYNAFADGNQYKEMYFEKKATLLLGMRYAPLRKEFSIVSRKKINKEAHRILLLTGGGDYEHIAANFTEQIIGKHSEYVFDVVAGNMSPDIDELYRLETENENMKLHVGINYIHELMCNADIAVSASGSTVYELCACGVPMITYTFADNQINASMCLCEKNAGIYVGDVRENSSFYSDLDSALCSLASDYKRRIFMSKMANSLCDGKGAERLARKLIE